MVSFLLGIIFLALLIAVSAIYIWISVKGSKSDPNNISREMRKYIRNNPKPYGVSNHGISMDDIQEIKVYNSDQMGL